MSQETKQPDVAVSAATPTHKPGVACWFCDDAHWIVDETKPIGTADRIVSCPACRWVDKHRMSVVGEASDWNPAWTRRTFEAFDQSAPEVLDGYMAALTFGESVKLAWNERRSGQAFAMRYDQPWALTLFGKFGTGKTYLAAAVANLVGMAGVPFLFCYSAKLWAYLGCISNPDSDVNYEGRLVSVMKAPLLILDEIGGSINPAGQASGLTESAWGRRHRLVEYRYSWRLPTIFLDQRHPSYWGDGAIADRITEDSNETVPHGLESYRSRGQRAADAELEQAELQPAALNPWDRGEGER